VLTIRNDALVPQLHQTPTKEPASAGASTAFRLDMFMASLKLYETGVGVLSMFIDNFEHRSPEAVLAINDLIRRIYPQRLHYSNGVEDVKNKGQLADSIQIGDWKEDFGAFAPTQPNGIPRFFLPQHILGLLGPRFYADAGAATGDILVQHVLDDRMYLVGFLEDADLAERLKGEKPDKRPYLLDPFWFSYVFVDKDEPQVKNGTMMRQLVEAATYPRWTEDGTFYGASRYSFMALTGSGYKVKNPFTGNYTRLVELCLVQRASVLRFREEASRIAKSIADSPYPDEVAQKIRMLHGEYIRFINQFYFLEATPVEQGLELYDLVRTQMRVQEQAETLKHEFAEMNAYAGLLQEESEKAREQAQKLRDEALGNALNTLTVIGAALLFPSFALSYFGLLDDWKAPLKAYPIFTLAVLFFGMVLVVTIFYQYRRIKQKIWSILLCVLLILFYLWILYALPHFGEWGWFK
jgi:hypothetical protein